MCATPSKDCELQEDPDPLRLSGNTVRTNAWRSPRGFVTPLHDMIDCTGLKKKKEKQSPGSHAMHGKDSRHVQEPGPLSDFASVNISPLLGTNVSLERCSNQAEHPLFSDYLPMVCSSGCITIIGSLVCTNIDRSFACMRLVPGRIRIPVATCRVTASESIMGEAWVDDRSREHERPP